MKQYEKPQLKTQRGESEPIMISGGIAGGIGGENELPPVQLGS